MHAGKSNIIGMPVALTSTSPHANRWFPCHRGVFYPFIHVNTTRTVRQFGSDSPVVSLKKTGVLPNQLLWDLRQMRYE